MPRLFTGIEIPPDVAGHLAFLRGGLPGARWIDRENYHLTLRFVGDIDRHVATEILHALGGVHRTRFWLSLNGLGLLGTRKPHTIAARLSASPELTELHAEHERLIRRLGLAPDQRKYTPHVTLARLRHTPDRDIAEYLSVRGGFRTRPFEVSRFVLFSSKDTTGGGPYIVEEEYPLLTAAA